MKCRCSIVFVMLSVVLTIVLSCNTDIDLCTDAEHPHLVKTTVDFIWGRYESQKPDTMFVVADRIIKHWKCGFAINTTTLGGHYLFNAPPPEPIAPSGEPEDSEDDGDTGEGDVTGSDDIDTDTDVGGEDISEEKKDVEGEFGILEENDEVAEGEPDVSEEGEEDVEDKPDIPEEDEVSEFKVRSGEYRILTFSRDTEELIYDDVTNYMNDVSNKSLSQELSVEYRAYDKRDPGLRKVVSDWLDYNPYAKYIQSEMPHVFYGVLERKDLRACKEDKFTFTPKPVTQTVEIRFNIRKAGNVDFTVDSVFAEISGVPYKINLANGYLDVSKTYKMMFGTELWNESFTEHIGCDEYGRKKVGCRALINVTSIVNSNSANIVSGPGILQVIIYTSAREEEDGLVRRKKIQGKINLCNTIRNADLIKVDIDGQYAVRTKDSGELVIYDQLVIDGNEIIENADNGNGIDRWKSCNDDIILDI